MEYQGCVAFVGVRIVQQRPQQFPLVGQLPLQFPALGGIHPRADDFDSFARRGRLGLHVTASGEDAHHVTEAAFKAVALALRQAVEPDDARSGIASTKGVL